MKTNMQKQGFTLIELLVVIVIIGILATISVATFSGYFKKARDAERQTAISNAGTIMKTARAVDTIITYDSSATAWDSATGGTITDTGELGLKEVLLEEGGYAIPAATNSINYYYVDNDTVDGFAFMACSEGATGSVYVNGTADVVAVIKTAVTQATPTLCTSSVTAPTQLILNTVTAGTYNVINLSD